MKWLLVALCVAVVFNAIMRWMEDRRRKSAEKALAMEQLSLHGDILRVLALLNVWADCWGDSPEMVREKLREALKR